MCSKVVFQPFFDGCFHSVLQFAHMPTVCRIGPYRFYFFSHEPNEPPHIHVDRDRFSAKFWLEEVILATNMGFRQNEVNKLHALIVKNQKQFLDKWYEYFCS